MRFIFRHFFLFIFFLFATYNLQAQVKLRYPTEKKAKKYFKKAIKLFQKKDYNKAIKYFDKTIKFEPGFVKSYYYKAGIYYELKEYQKSELEYKKALNIDSLYNTDIYYSLAVLQEKQNKLSDALSSYKLFLKKSNKTGKLENKARVKIKNIPFLIEELKKEVTFHPIKLGEGINTINSEYLPALTGDKQSIIFTRRINHQEDLYISKFVDGKWQTATPIRELNTRSDEGAHTLSPDGKTLVFTICDRRRTYGNCDLFISYKRNGKWSSPKNLGKTVNSPYWDSQPSISADGNTLYFSSNRPGGIGGKDIWMSQKIKLNKWSKPVCLDSMINTILNEETPFIHVDNRTLYFTSNGHVGMGGKDLFLSKKEGNHWSKAVNLGYPINTPNEEGALFVSLDGNEGFFSTDRNSKNYKNLDIYYFKFPDKFKPEPVTYVKGVVLDKEDKTPINAIINLYNDLGEKIDSINYTTDSFFVSLPLGNNYNLTVRKTGYVFYSDRFVLDKKNSLTHPTRLKIELTKISKNKVNKESEPIVLKNIIFNTNSAEINTVKSRIELETLTRLLLDNPEIKIKISGHTDNVGDEHYNMKLSLNRAKAVYDYLVARDISSERLLYNGCGETRPVSTNDTKKGRQINRRVEFIIIY